jgi:DNA-binding CsgD family transcriptional regulator
MVRTIKGGSSMRQQAYARRVFDGKGQSKQQIALDCGYSPNSARSVVAHIESKPGFNNAMAKLASESNNLALKAMSEFKARGFTDFTNNELISALNAIGGAWAKFNDALIKTAEIGRGNTSSTNKLRTVILQQVENQTVYAEEPQPPESVLDVIPDVISPEITSQTNG